MIDLSTSWCLNWFTSRAVQPLLLFSHIRRKWNKPYYSPYKHYNANNQAVIIGVASHVDKMDKCLHNIQWSHVPVPCHAQQSAEKAAGVVAACSGADRRLPFSWFFHFQGQFIHVNHDLRVSSLHCDGALHTLKEFRLSSFFGVSNHSKGQEINDFHVHHNKAGYSGYGTTVLR